MSQAAGNFDLAWKLLSADGRTDFTYNSVTGVVEMRLFLNDFITLLAGQTVNDLAVTFDTDTELIHLAYSLRKKDSEDMHTRITQYNTEFEIGAGEGLKISELARRFVFSLSDDYLAKEFIGQVQSSYLASQPHGMRIAAQKRALDGTAGTTVNTDLIAGPNVDITYNSNQQFVIAAPTDGMVPMTEVPNIISTEGATAVIKATKYHNMVNMNIKVIHNAPSAPRILTGSFSPLPASYWPISPLTISYNDFAPPDEGTQIFTIGTDGVITYTLSYTRQIETVLMYFSK
jgi:hypothetical protein